MKTTLEQWRMFKAVVDHGGYAQAAEAIFKSQSTISYGVHKLQEQLGVTLLEIEGRKAILTEPGRLLLQRAENLLNQAECLDQLAGRFRQGVEPIVRLATDMIFPSERLFHVLEQFSHEFPDTRIELEEFVLNGGNEMLEQGEIDLLITSALPMGVSGAAIHRERFMPVSAPTHPLQQLSELDFSDLTHWRQVVLRDSSRKHRQDAGWLGSHQRWTVTHINTSLNIVRRGLAFAWLPESRIQEDLQSGLLQPLPMKNEASRFEELFLVTASLAPGPATRHLAGLLTAAGNLDTPR
ncbi:LysR family transcriptional regulator [Parathalassolituus penaei]|uniref:LysR family transcriptional regulator n=1 Tax=Parathalassolituus penaei TaxID=2997323 RepID=A0A9X3EFM8_9GAMM|nr:LysR family transcriptional regulator [Parathalassolituus penaei]MCY0966386.1 LysR family transcriptional regulator [Parathalassolituus penaei]